VLHKGDTINIHFKGVDYAIDILETKPEDQICCVEADINLDFEEPKDYVAPVPVARATTKAKAAEAQKEAGIKEKVKELQSKVVRIDGAKLTAKQMRTLGQYVKEEEEKLENPDFDPRKHRMPNGIRPQASTSFGQGGKGIKLK